MFSWLVLTLAAQIISVALGPGVGDRLAVGVALGGAGEFVAVGGPGVLEGVAVGRGVFVRLEVGVWVGVKVCEAVAVAVSDAVGVAVAVSVGVAVPEAVGVALGV